MLPARLRICPAGHMSSVTYVRWGVKIFRTTVIHPAEGGAGLLESLFSGFGNEIGGENEASRRTDGAHSDY
jgi:hypothetical protein